MELKERMAEIVRLQEELRVKAKRREELGLQLRQVDNLLNEIKLKEGYIPRYYTKSIQYLELQLEKAKKKDQRKAILKELLPLKNWITDANININKLKLGILENIEDPYCFLVDRMKNIISEYQGKRDAEANEELKNVYTEFIERVSIDTGILHKAK